jgi:hypothetical protein
LLTAFNALADTLDTLFLLIGLIEDGVVNFNEGFLDGVEINEHLVAGLV